MNFDGMFPLLAMIVLAIVLCLGILTQVRVFKVGFEDLAYVLAMNRLRAAYASFVLLTLSPFVVVLGYELHGHRHTSAALTRALGP
jgi:hypothetical protein